MLDGLVLPNKYGWPLWSWTYLNLDKEVKRKRRLFGWLAWTQHKNSAKHKISLSTLHKWTKYVHQSILLSELHYKMKPQIWLDLLWDIDIKLALISLQKASTPSYKVK
jgi:hypothetical protein